VLGYVSSVWTLDGGSDPLLPQGCSTAGGSRRLGAARRVLRLRGCGLCTLTLTAAPHRRQLKVEPVGQGAMGCLAV